MDTFQASTWACSGSCTTLAFNMASMSTHTNIVAYFRLSKGKKITSGKYGFALWRKIEWEIMTHMTAPPAVLICR